MADTDVHDDAPRKIASAFVDARRAASGVQRYPGVMPRSLEEAYQIQDSAITLAASPIGGWKVGRILVPHAEILGADRLVGPIFSDTIVDTGDAVMPIFADGFGAAEAEYLLRIGTAPDPAKHHYTIEEVATLIDAVHIGIEIASSPLAAINDLGPAVTISDFGNNHGLVIGAALPDWRNSDFALWPVSLSIDGRPAGEGIAAAMPDGPIGAARFLFEHLAARGFALTPGQWISTGAITGVHRVVPGSAVEARFGDSHTVRCTIEAATAR